MKRKQVKKLFNNLKETEETLQLFHVKPLLIKIELIDVIIKKYDQQNRKLINKITHYRTNKFGRRKGSVWYKAVQRKQLIINKRAYFKWLRKSLIRDAQEEQKLLLNSKKGNIYRYRYDARFTISNELSSIKGYNRCTTC
jgi:hypothetical protein